MNESRHLAVIQDRLELQNFHVEKGVWLESWEGELDPNYQDTLYESHMDGAMANPNKNPWVPHKSHPLIALFPKICWWKPGKIAPNPIPSYFDWRFLGCFGKNIFRKWWWNSWWWWAPCDRKNLETKITLKQTNPSEVIQFVTFWSPNVGGHDSPFKRVTFSPSQKGYELNHQEIMKGLAIDTPTPVCWLLATHPNKALSSR